MAEITTAIILNIPFYSREDRKEISTVSITLTVPEYYSEECEELLSKIDKIISKFHNIKQTSDDLCFDEYNKFSHAVMYIFTNSCQYDIVEIQIVTNHEHKMEEVKRYAEHLSTVIEHIDQTKNKRATVYEIMSILIRLKFISRDVCMAIYTYLYEKGLAKDHDTVVSNTGPIYG